MFFVASGLSESTLIVSKNADTFLGVEWKYFGISTNMFNESVAKDHTCYGFICWIGVHVEFCARRPF